MQKKRKILIVVGTFYKDIADLLLRGASSVIDSSSYDYDTVSVPGSFEIPSAIVFSIMGNREMYAGYVALGCIIKGETDHYHYVSENVLRLIGDIGVQHAVPVGLAVLTVGCVDLAVSRADPEGRDAGGRAARAVLRMIELHDLCFIGEDSPDYAK